jgi:hypothetical protein
VFILLYVIILRNLNEGKMKKAEEENQKAMKKLEKQRKIEEDMMKKAEERNVNNMKIEEVWD